MQPQLTTLFIKIPRNTEVTPESAQTFLAALTQINSVSSLSKLMGGRSQALSLEIALVNQQIVFLVTCDTSLVPFVEAQIQSNYPLAIMEKIDDPLIGQHLEVSQLTLAKGSFYPINVYPAFQDIDPLSSVLSVLSKERRGNVAMVQFALESVSGSWQNSGQRFADRGTKNEDGSYSARPDASVIKEKITYPGFAVSFRIAATTKNTLTALVSSLGVFTRADGNSFIQKRKSLFKKSKPFEELISRKVTDNQILNIQELATLWHLPSEKIKTASIAWGVTVLSEPPGNLPAAIDSTEEEKAQINFFARTYYKNQDAIFGIKKRDRSRHAWVIGKTGTGKSTLIANMAIDDIKKGRGVGVIDPHGDLCETILNYIPTERIKDVIYFNPGDKTHAITINPLEVTGKEEAELVVSGLMSIFTKIWANVWSARMEYILRNTLLTLAQVPGTTLADVLAMLANDSYRKGIVQNLKDEPLRKFWIDEYEKMPDRLQKEAISPIQNKVGQFVTSPLIRRIIGESKSSVYLDEIMDDGKILLANLSQGKIGEDNSALLGATLITKLQQGAMRRVNIPESERRDFYLYVDEFQNFATTSFIKVLSEARKYRLNLMLANQYMAQIPEEVQKAILGNVGSLVAFGVGADDAQIIHQEYAEVFSQNDLVNLANYQIAIKLMIDGHSSRPFLATTLPLPAITTNNKQAVINQSKTNWATKGESKVEHPPATPPPPTRPAPRHQQSPKHPQPQRKPHHQPTRQPARHPHPKPHPQKKQHVLYTSKDKK